MMLFDEKGEWKLNPKYKEIEKLHNMLSEADVPHTYCRFMDGWQVCLISKEIVVGDAVEHSGSYGKNQDLIEVYGFGLNEPVGWLTAEAAFEYFKMAWNEVRR